MDEPDTAKAGRPETKAASKEITISNMDVLTYRMLNALVDYGRFGRTRPEVALFIIRNWLWENEARLKTGIAASDKPLGVASIE